MKNNLKLLYFSAEKKSSEKGNKYLLKYFTRIFMTSSKHETLKSFHKYKPDLIILDCSKTTNKSIEVLRELREYNLNVEIIILTENMNKSLLVEIINTKVFAYLTKPIKKSDLEENIQKVIEVIYLKNTLPFYKNFSYNPKCNQLFYNKERIPLTHKEQNLLKYFYDNQSTHRTACTISQSIFPEHDKLDLLCNGVVQLISRFKKKMLHFCKEDEFFIDKVYALGYKLKT